MPKYDVKYLKMGREMAIYNRNVMHISLQDTHEYNQHLSEQIRNGDLDLYASLSSDFQTFMEENVEKTFGRDFYLSFSND